jgi:hypothetical protein
MIGVHDSAPTAKKNLGAAQMVKICYFTKKFSFTQLSCATQSAHLDPPLGKETKTQKFVKVVCSGTTLSPPNSNSSKA